MLVNPENIKNFLLDILYPNKCPCCEKFIVWNELLCSECISEIECMEKAEFCEKCGRSPCICFRKPFYDRAVIYRPYDKLVKKGILSMKNGDNINFGKYCGIKLAELIGETDADFIIPVPMSARKKRIRGYNQSEVIADAISEIINIPVRNDILRMKYSSIEQHSRKVKERSEIINYLEMSDKNISGMKIILCDDIITTANTINSYSAMLKKAGADEVTAVLIAGTIFKEYGINENKGER